MKLDVFPYQLRFKFPFKIAHGLRQTTDVVYVRVSLNNAIGWGEATLPPYLPETQQTVIQFLRAVNLSGLEAGFDPRDVFAQMDALPGNYAAKAALDMALWHLKSQLTGQSIGQLLQVDNTAMPLCTYTIGVSDTSQLAMKVQHGTDNGFKLFKLKLNGENDIQTIEAFKALTNAPFAVDVNQGWKSIAAGAQQLAAIARYSAVLVEQPLPVDLLGNMSLLRTNTSMPLFADENCQTISDLDKMPGHFDGVNIKLMKCGGITPAFEMIKKARVMGLKLLIGCMSESSVGCTAAAQLASLCDYADLDGPWLVNNNPFKGLSIANGYIKLGEVEQIADLNMS